MSLIQICALPVLPSGVSVFIQLVKMLPSLIVLHSLRSSAYQLCLHSASSLAPDEQLNTQAPKSFLLLQRPLRETFLAVLANSRASGSALPALDVVYTFLAFG